MATAATRAVVARTGFNTGSDTSSLLQQEKKHSTQMLLRMIRVCFMIRTIDHQPFREST